VTVMIMLILVVVAVNPVHLDVIIIVVRLKKMTSVDVVTVPEYLKVPVSVVLQQTVMVSFPKTSDVVVENLDQLDVIMHVVHQLK